MEAKQWKKLLVDYAKALGQCINYEKSTLFFFNTPNDLQLRILSILSCKTIALSGTYLGLPLMVKEVTPTFWNTILERMQKKLTGWKGKFLSSAGKFQLLVASL
ncbi:hypothetical protein SUGI_1199570 [Cryptomeria japonica]|nr:hypothetical protein SUGI_1199570 [Cryptomeria japonica]